LSVTSTKFVHHRQQAPVAKQLRLDPRAEQRDARRRAIGTQEAITREIAVFDQRSKQFGRARLRISEAPRNVHHGHAAALFVEHFEDFEDAVSRLDLLLAEYRRHHPAPCHILLCCHVSMTYPSSSRKPNFAGVISQRRMVLFSRVLR